MDIVIAHTALVFAFYLYIKVLGKYVNWFVKKSMLRRHGSQVIIETKSSYPREVEPEVFLDILRPIENFEKNDIVNTVVFLRHYGNLILFLTILFFAGLYTLNAHGIGNPDKKNIGDPLFLDFYFYLLLSYALYRFIFFFPVNLIAYFNLIRKMRGYAAHKLMILRVFGSKRHTKFLFSTFTSIWSSFGPSITVMDPVLIERQFRLLKLIEPRSLLSRSINLPITISVIVIGVFVNFINLDFSLFLIFSPLICIFIPFIYIRWFLNRKFKAIVKTVKKSFPKKRNSKMEFPPSQLYCYDDAWKSAVIETGKNVDLVLMDIRDYSTDRAGSSWELNYLASNFSFDKVLFLADTDEQAQNLKLKLAISLKEIPPGSPNDLDKIQIHVFVSTEQDIYGNGTDITRHLYSMVSPKI
jgi:hypothetical protein